MELVQIKNVNSHSQFRDLSEEMVDLLATADVRFSPYSDPKLPWFSLLSMVQQQVVLSKITQLIKIYRLTLAQGGDLRNSKMLLWTAMKEFGLRFKSDFLSLVDEDDVVEIYDTKHVQIFCNMKFYEYCSYTVEDIFCRTWTDLFERSKPEVTTEIVQVAQEIFSKNNESTCPMSYLGPQAVREKSSVFRFEYELTMKYLSPITSDKTGDVMGAVSIERVKLLNGMVVEENQNSLLAAREPLL